MELVSEYLKRIDPKLKDKEKLFDYINRLIEKEDYTANEILTLIGKDNIRRKILSEREDNSYRTRHNFRREVSATWFEEASLPEPPPTLQARDNKFLTNELRDHWRNTFVRRNLGVWGEDNGTNSDTN